MEPKRTRSYTTTSGERVTKYNDGTEKRIPAPTATPTVAPTVQGGISGATLARQTPNVQLPPPINIQPDIQGTRAAGQSLLDFETQRAEQEAAQAQAPITQSEQQIRSMFGMLNTEGQARDQLDEKKGVNAYSQDLQKFQQTLRNQIAELDQQDLDNINANEQSRLDSSRRDITKRTYNAMSAEANLQQSIKRASQVAQTRSTIAAIEVTQGNLEAATEQVDKALKAIYDPIRNALQQEMFFLERNDKRFDAAQKEVSDLRMKAIDRQFAEIDRATSLVDSAVASGGASPSDIKAMVAERDPAKQSQLAMSILASVNSADRNLERAYKQMQIENIQDQIAARNSEETDVKPLTQAQYTALGYAERVVDAAIVIDDVGNQFASTWALLGSALPNSLKSEDRQKFEQAQRNFVNAVLRRESGAAIAESEFESAAMQYFPQPGDSLGVLAQKKVNRETVQRNLLREGGQPTTTQDNSINDPLGLGFPTSSKADPLGLNGLTQQSTPQF
jgi:hypothetical protein